MQLLVSGNVLALINILKPRHPQSWLLRCYNSCLSTILSHHTYSAFSQVLFLNAGVSKGCLVAKALYDSISQDTAWLLTLDWLNLYHFPLTHTIVTLRQCYFILAYPWNCGLTPENQNRSLPSKTKVQNPLFFPITCFCPLSNYPLLFWKFWASQWVCPANPHPRS